MTDEAKVGSTPILFRVNGMAAPVKVETAKTIIIDADNIIAIFRFWNLHIAMVNIIRDIINPLVIPIIDSLINNPSSLIYQKIGCYQ